MNFVDDIDSLVSFLDEPAPQVVLLPLVELPAGTADPRLLRISYSSLLDLHACPRYYQLKKLQAEKAEEDISSSITFAYGHAMGEGIQQYLIASTCGDSDPLQTAVWKAFLAWDYDLLAENDKQKKSFLRVVAALTIFDEHVRSGLIADDYEVAIFNGKPAAELSFKIDLGDGVYYRGYVDLILRHKITGEFMILELKTSSANYVNHYTYKNSAQAIGYSVVLDKIAPGTTSYGVQYLVWMTKLDRYEAFDFPKTFKQRVHWIQDLLWDKKNLLDLVGFYGNDGVWQTRGESCVRFNRVCEYMDICGQQTERLTKPLREDMMVEKQEYDFTYTVAELLQ